MVSAAAIRFQERRGRQVLAAGVFVLILIAWQLGGCAALASAPAAQAATADAAPAVAQRAARSVPYQGPRSYQVPATDSHPAYAVYASGANTEAHTALLVLHGMGGDGPSMASLVLPYAQTQNWTVIAPTIPYGDWRDPVAVADEDVRLAPQLTSILDSVAADTGETIAGQALVFGFSRGAQEALRYSLFFPERVQAVASLSAGTYTLPVASVRTAAGSTLNAPFPYGVADLAARCGRPLDTQRLAAVRFLVGVGAADNRAADVPRQWDPYVGQTRVERATRFGQMLSQLGYQAQVVVVPGVGHEVNGAMLEPVMAFLTQSAPQS